VNSISRKARGMRTQKVVAEWFRKHLWPNAESAGAGRSGDDILGTGDVHIEVKARRGFYPWTWLRQSSTHGDDGLHCVVFRPDGAGEATVDRWGVLVTLEEFTRLLAQAGYGVMPGPEGPCPEFDRLLGLEGKNDDPTHTGNSTPRTGALA
jgi:hypothetical protein